jgi:hypothetical protein
MKRKLGSASKPKSNLDQMIAVLVEKYGVSLLLWVMFIHEPPGAVHSAIGRLFEKLKINWDDLSDTFRRPAYRRLLGGCCVRHASDN